MAVNQGPLSMQLWSTRGDDPLADQLGYLKAMGYSDVQPFHDQYGDVPALKALLDEHGLTSVSGLFNIRMFEGTARPVIEAARTLGMGLVIAPWLDPEDRPTDADGWRAMHRRLQRMKAVIEDAGLAFAWHNHDFEFQRLPSGAYGIELMLGDDIDLAADLAWITVAGEDATAWLDRYAGRVPMVHIKDVAAPGTNEDQMGFADVGAGILDWPSLWAVCDRLNIPLRVAEHDLPGDWRRFARASAKKLGELRIARP